MNVVGTLLALALQATAVPSPSPSASPSPLPPVTPTPAASAPAAAISVSPFQANLQPGQSQTLAVANAAGQITASVNVPVVTLSIDQDAHTIALLAGQQPGRATLTIRDARGSTVTIPVRVAFSAATLPAQILVRVTGSTIDPSWLQTQVQRALLRGITLQPGLPARALQLTPYTLPPQLGPGAQAAVPVTVHVAGGDQYFDTDGQITIALQNVALDPFSAPLLFYDDDPEKIPANGVFFRATVQPDAPARLYYYHQNTLAPRRLLIVLTAQNASTVQVIDASAGPNIDVMSVGHAVSRDFLVRKPLNEGVVTDVAPGVPLVLDDFKSMQPLDGAAGTIGIRVTNGGPVTVTVVAVDPTASASDVASALAGSQLPGDGHNRTGVFDIRTFGQATLSYTIGDEASIDYGAGTPPNTGAVPNGHDYGEYGVVRTIGIDINNTTQQPATVYLYEKPLGGVVRSSFLVNGQLVEVGCARLSNPYEIGPPLSVDPGTTHINLQTMTDGGSNYPLEVGVTATPPLPTTPPMSSADGCFPKAQSAPATLLSPAPQASASPAPEPTGRAPLDRGAP